MLLMFIVIGSAAWKNFDFETLEFKKFWLGMLYIFTMLLIIVIMLRPLGKKREETPQAVDRSDQQ